MALVGLEHETGDARPLARELVKFATDFQLADGQKKRLQDFPETFLLMKYHLDSIWINSCGFITFHI